MTIALTYNPASQIATRTLSSDLFAWTGHGSGSTSSTVNGLNQLSVSGGTAFGYDSRGNMTSDGARTYAFSSENLLAGIAVGSSSASLGYDPAMRLYQGVEGGNATRFLFEGGDLIGEYANSSLINRYVPGPGTDEPMGTASPSGSRSWTYADERGSIVATEGSTIRINSYDEYGKPGATPTGRFGYTGLPRLNNQLHYARARFYDSNSGRFVQPDPIGYSDGMNMYGYVGGDPVNFADPSGLCGVGEVRMKDGIATPATEEGGDIVIQGRYFCQRIHAPGGGGSGGAGGVGGGRGGGGGGPILVDPKPDPRRDACGNVLPPASRRYSVPPGYRENPADPKHHTVFDARGRNAVNPYYQTARGRSGINWRGVGSDLGEITALVALSQATGAFLRFIFGGTRGPQVAAANRVNVSIEDASRNLGGQCSR